jgi:hypothetical protein
VSRSYQVGKPRVLTRAHVYGGGKTTYAWDPDPYYGTHPTTISAKRAYIEANWPELKGAPDACISRFWDGEPRQLHKAKIVKVESLKKKEKRCQHS